MIEHHRHTDTPNNTDIVRLIDVMIAWWHMSVFQTGSYGKPFVTGYTMGIERNAAVKIKWKLEKDIYRTSETSYE